MSQWYIIYNGTQVGPMSQDQLLAYGLNAKSQVWCEGMPQWAPAYTIPALMSLIQAGNPAMPGAHPNNNGMCPPPSYQQGYQPSYNQGYSDKSKTTAGVLALLLGGLGVQYFYCGKTTAGLLTILLSAVTCGCWNILTFIQGILMLTMSQEEFDQKFVYTDKSFPLF